MSTPFDAVKAAHQTRMQLSGIMCERELNREEQILHAAATRYMNRLFIVCDNNLERQQQEQQNENPPRISDSRSEEIPPGAEPGLLPSD